MPVLEPVGVSVLTDVVLLSEAPKADILLLHHKTIGKMNLILLKQIVVFLRRVYMSDVTLPNELTPESVMEMGQEWINAIIKFAPLDEILLYHKPDERLHGLSESQIRAYLETLQQSKH